MQWPAAGAYVNPTLFGQVDNSMTTARQELFGPVASVILFDGAHEAISIASYTAQPDPSCNVRASEVDEVRNHQV